MIQNMNNTLVKHHKLFFSVLLVIIVIGFVMFFGAMDPSSFLGELMGSGQNNFGKVFDEDVTIDDLAAVSKKAHNLPWLAGDIDTDNLFYLAAFEKAARRHGFSVSDAELKESITAMFSDEKGKFSQEAYKKFIDDLAKNRQLTATDFEDALRMHMMIEKFRMAAFDGLSVSDNEIDAALEALSLTATYRTVSFGTEAFKADTKVTDGEAQEYYAKNKDKYLESSAVVVYLNPNGIKDIKIDAKQIEEAKASGLDAYKGKTDAEIADLLKAAPAAEAAAKKVADFSFELFKSRGKEDFIKDPVNFVKAAAAEKGLEVFYTEGLTNASPATPTLNTEMINAICKIRDVNTFTPVMKNGDASAFAVLTGRNEAAQEKLTKTVIPVIKAELLARKLNSAALAKANEFYNAVKDGKITASNLEAEAKVYGATVGAETPETPLTGISTQLKMFGSLFAQNEQMMKQMNPTIAREIAFMLASPVPYENFCSAPNESASINFCVKCVQSTGIEVTPFVRSIVKDALLLNKQQAALLSFSDWMDKNVQRYMTKEEAQQQESAGE